MTLRVENSLIYNQHGAHCKLPNCSFPTPMTPTMEPQLSHRHSSCLSLEGRRNSVPWSRAPSQEMRHIIQCVLVKAPYTHMHNTHITTQPSCRRAGLIPHIVTQLPPCRRHAPDRSRPRAPRTTAQHKRHSAAAPTAVLGMGQILDVFRSARPAVVGRLSISYRSIPLYVCRHHRSHSSHCKRCQWPDQQGCVACVLPRRCWGNLFFLDRVACQLCRGDHACVIAMCTHHISVSWETQHHMLVVLGRGEHFRLFQTCVLHDRST